MACYKTRIQAADRLHNGVGQGSGPIFPPEECSARQGLLLYWPMSPGTPRT
jgi:hypothetical protein